MKYLIADDDPFVCEQIERYLASLPDTEYCLQAGDGLVALKLLSTGRLDAAFVDWQMPHLDGVDLLRALPDRLPVVVVSARTDLDSQISQFGLAAYLHKPLEPQHILRAVEKVRALAAAA